MDKLETCGACNNADACGRHDSLQNPVPKGVSVRFRPPAPFLNQVKLSRLSRRTGGGGSFAFDGDLPGINRAI